MGWDLLVSGVVQATPDKLRSSYSVMTYHKEGPACGKIPCDPTSSEADCEYPVDPNAERLKKNRNGFKDIDMKKNFEHKISRVLPESIAEELEIEPGDVLLAVNDQPIEDVFDYHYYTNEEYLTVLIRKPDGEEWELEIEKEFEEDLGIEFESSLMDEYRSCRNKCIFCFIDQMPPGMRKTLYFKDDDSRLSFLQGNYVTLTNMSDHDIDRIIRYHLGPINISFQTTNPKLRCKMLNNRFAGDVFSEDSAAGRCGDRDERTDRALPWGQ